METVFHSFRETGFFRAAEDHGPTAVFGGITRTMAMDRGAMTESFREILRDIKSGGFAQRFQGGRERLSDARVRASHDARLLADFDG